MVNNYEELRQHLVSLSLSLALSRSLSLFSQALSSLSFSLSSCSMTSESVCCLLVLNLVTSTPQWIRLCVNVCSNVLGSCGL